MQRAPHPPKGFIPSEGWASGSQGHPWSPTDTPAAGRRPIAGLPRPPTAPPSASAAAHRPLRGHRRPPPRRRTALPNALGGRRRRGGRRPGTGPGCAVTGSPPPPARSAPLRAGPLAPSMRRGGRGAPRSEGGGAERGRVRAEGDGQGGDTGDKRGRGRRQGRERSKTRMRRGMCVRGAGALS